MEVSKLIKSKEIKPLHPENKLFIDLIFLVSKFVKFIDIKFSQFSKAESIYFKLGVSKVDKSNDIKFLSPEKIYSILRTFFVLVNFMFISCNKGHL